MFICSKGQVMGSDKTKTIKAGTLLIRESDTSRKMFILKEGKVKVFKNYLGKKITLEVLGKGEVFGELSFFDAEPRSASVEALTDIEVIEVNGEEAEAQIKNLPGWVNAIFKSVFYRFRETDNKLTVLQNMYEFQKKTLSRDIVSQTIYLELLRYNRALKLVFNDYNKIDSSKVVYRDYYMSIDAILGKKDIGLRAYFRSFIENNLFEIIEMEDAEDLLQLNFDEIESLNNYLHQEIDSERYLVLSHSSIALLRACIGYTDAKESEEKSVRIVDLKLDKMAFYVDAVKELIECGLITEVNEFQQMSVSDVQMHYVSQSIIKSFDHDLMTI